MTDLTIASRPRRVSGVSVLSRTDDRTVLAGPGPERVFELNDTALALWELCDGTTSIAEMIVAASDLFAAKPANLERDVLHALVELLHDGLIVDVRE